MSKVATKSPPVLKPTQRHSLLPNSPKAQTSTGKSFRAKKASTTEALKPTNVTTTGGKLNQSTKKISKVIKLQNPSKYTAAINKKKDSVGSTNSGNKKQSITKESWRQNTNPSTIPLKKGESAISKTHKSSKTSRQIGSAKPSPMKMAGPQVFLNKGGKSVSAAPKNQNVSPKQSPKVAPKEKPNPQIPQKAIVIPKTPINSSTKKVLADTLKPSIIKANKPIISVTNRQKVIPEKMASEPTVIAREPNIKMIKKSSLEPIRSMEKNPEVSKQLETYYINKTVTDTQTDQILQDVIDVALKPAMKNSSTSDHRVESIGIKQKKVDVKRNQKYPPKKPGLKTIQENTESSQKSAKVVKKISEIKKTKRSKEFSKQDILRMVEEKRLEIRAQRKGKQPKERVISVSSLSTE